MVQPVLRLGELEIDILNRCVRVAGHELQLTALDQSLRYLLAAHAGRVMSRDEILDHLWGVDFMAESNVVDRHVRNLRAKLQNDWRRPRYIATEPGPWLPLCSHHRCGRGHRILRLRAIAPTLLPGLAVELIGPEPGGWELPGHVRVYAAGVRRGLRFWTPPR